MAPPRRPANLVVLLLVAFCGSGEAGEAARDPAAETRASRAVDRALEYLRSSQDPDGSWISGYGKSTGVVSLAAMAFLARGHVPGRGKYGETLDRAVGWVVQQSRDGFIVRDTSHGPMYCHAISTLMLGEVLGMVNEERKGFESLARVHQAAVSTILRAQAVSKDSTAAGGWRYNVNSNDSDISVSGWTLLALRAAQDCGVAVPRKNIDQAVAYIKRCAHPLGGFGYQPGGDPNLARSGTGVLALQICGDFNSPEALRGGEYILKTPLVWQGPFFYYAVYYCSQGMYQLGGPPWESFRDKVETVLLAHQNSDGSWPAPPNETHEHQAGPAYMTAIAVLALSVEFKYLPIYQR
jgi:prenyltransferase/squalene oxidase-like repeat protein